MIKEHYKPNHMQMMSAVRGDDRFIPRPKFLTPLRVVMLVAVLLLFGFVAYRWMTGGA